MNVGLFKKTGLRSLNSVDQREKIKSEISIHAYWGNIKRKTSTTAI